MEKESSGKKPGNYLSHNIGSDLTGNDLNEESATVGGIKGFIKLCIK